MIQMLNPVSQRREGEIEAAPRLSGLDGKKIGLLHNGKHGGEELLVGIRDELQRRFPNAEFDYRRKPHAAAPANFIGRVADSWDCAVVAVGDCGSCSSWSVFDSIELEKVGIPTVLVVSRPFVAMNKVEAKRLLYPTLSMLVVEHPLAHLPAEQLEAKGAALVDDAIAMLTGDAAGAAPHKLKAVGA